MTVRHEIFDLHRTDLGGRPTVDLVPASMIRRGAVLR